MNKIIFVLVGAGLFSLAHAEGARKLVIHSKADHYELVLEGGNATVNGKPADLGPFKELLPLLTDPLTGECAEKHKNPDATVTEEGKTRSIYVQAGLVTDGENCLTVDGDGLLYFPIHRDFLIGAKNDSITLKSPVKITRQDTHLVTLKKDGNEWLPTDSTILLNWDFFERMENSLQNFSIRFRALPELGKDKLKVVIRSGEQDYVFYKVGDVSWGLQKPGSKYLETSDDWSFWYNLENGVVEDRFAPQIHLIEDPKQDKGARIGALAKLETAWSPNLRQLYHTLLLKADEDHDIQAVALKRLRGKPSTETTKVMARFLLQTTDDDFRRSATQVLKITYPKGPLYKPNASDDEKQKVLDFWRKQMHLG